MSETFLARVSGFEQANLHHPTIAFTVETFDTKAAFLDTVVYKGTRFKDTF